MVGADSLGRHERILLLRRQSTIEKHRADEQIYPAQDQMHPEGETKLHNFKSAEIVKHQRHRQQQRAGHERGPGQFPSGTEAQITIAEQTDEPDRQGINRGQQRPHDEQPKERADGREAQNVRRPRTPRGPRVRLIRGDDVAGRISQLGLAEQGEDADGVAPEFKLKIRRGTQRATVLHVHAKGQNPAFSQQHRRILAPVQFAAVDFPRVRQFRDGGIDRGVKTIVQNPHHGGGADQSNDRLHYEETFKRAARERRHAPRRDGFPGKGWLGERTHESETNKNDRLDKISNPPRPVILLVLVLVPQTKSRTRTRTTTRTSRCRTGVVPVSILKKSLQVLGVPHSTITTCAKSGSSKVRDRRDACPTTWSGFTLSFPSAHSGPAAAPPPPARGNAFSSRHPPRLPRNKCRRFPTSRCRRTSRSSRSWTDRAARISI